MDKTAVAILNYNGVDYLKRFLPSVVKYSTDCHIVVIDNNSSDESLEFLKSDYPDIQTIVLEENYGFSGGYNRGLKQVEADNYILLNSDAEVTEGWAAGLIEYMNNHPEVAICQPKILSLNQKTRFDHAGAAGGFVDQLGYPFCRGRIFDHLEEDRGQYDDTRLIFWAAGSCFFIRSKVWWELGGFDEDFFAHMEEIDLCWRSHRAGYKTAFVAESKVYHMGAGTLKDGNPYKTYLNFRNGLQLLVKNCHLLQLIWKLPVRMMLDLVAALRFLLTGYAAHTGAVIKAEIAFIGRLPGTWAKRAQFKAPFNSELYGGVIVWDYFVRGKKTFRLLTGSSSTK